MNSKTPHGDETDPELIRRHHAGSLSAADGKKLLVSLAMEGKFASDGLQAIDDGDDILMAMARELVTEKGIGESADAVWKRLVEKQAEVFGVRAAETSTSKMESPAESVPEVIIPPVAPIPAGVTQLMMFGMSHDPAQRRKRAQVPKDRHTVGPTRIVPGLSVSRVVAGPSLKYCCLIASYPDSRT